MVSEEFAPQISDYRHRIWVWCDLAAIPAANAAINRVNNGNAWDAANAQYEEGDLCGVSMTKAEYSTWMAALDPFIVAGTVRVWPDQHGNLDDEGKERTDTIYATRKSLEDVEIERGATRKPETMEGL